MNNIQTQTIDISSYSIQQLKDMIVDLSMQEFALQRNKNIVVSQLLMKYQELENINNKPQQKPIVLPKLKHITPKQENVGGINNK